MIVPPFSLKGWDLKTDERLVGLRDFKIRFVVSSEDEQLEKMKLKFKHLIVLEWRGGRKSRKVHQNVLGFYNQNKCEYNHLVAFASQEASRRPLSSITLLSVPRSICQGDLIYAVRIYLPCEVYSIITLQFVLSFLAFSSPQSCCHDASSPFHCASIFQFLLRQEVAGSREQAHLQPY